MLKFEFFQNDFKYNFIICSSEINEELLKQTQLQFYQEEILTDQKKRQLMDIEKDFFEVARRYFKSRTEKDNVH